MSLCNSRRMMLSRRILYWIWKRSSAKAYDLHKYILTYIFIYLLTYLLICLLTYTYIYIYIHNYIQYNIVQYNTTHHIALNLLPLLFFSLSFIYFSLTFYFSRIDSQGSYRRIYPPLEGEDPFRSFLDSQPPVFADTVTSKVYIYMLKVL